MQVVAAVQVTQVEVPAQEDLAEEAEVVLIQDNRVLTQLDTVQAEAAEDLTAAEAEEVQTELL